MRALAGCDRLTVSPALLNELEADQAPLSPVFPPQHEASLAEGTRGFHTDSEKLPKLLGQPEPAAAAR